MVSYQKVETTPFLEEYPRVCQSMPQFFLHIHVLIQDHLEHADKNFKLGTLVYLKVNPADKDIAHLWLTRLRKLSIVTSFEQEILSMLAERYYSDKVLSILILDIFLGLERMTLSSLPAARWLVSFFSFETLTSIALPLGVSPMSMPS